MKHNIPNQSGNSENRRSVCSPVVNPVVAGSVTRAVMPRHAAPVRQGCTSSDRKHIKRRYRPPSPSGDKKAGTAIASRPMVRCFGCCD